MVVSAFDNSTPILLMCYDTPVGSIGALRSLGRLGVPSYAVDVESWGRVWASRYCRECFHWDPLDAKIEQSLERLLEIGRHIGRRALLVPTFDEAAIFAATYYDRLQEYFIYPHQTAGLVRSLVSKKEMYFAARRVGVPVPETSWPQTRDEMIQFADSARFPVTLKAIRGMPLRLKAGVTAFIVGSARELMELYDQYEDPVQPNLMLQEYIPGADSCGWGFNGYFNEKSECVFGGTTRRLHQAPVHVGITSLAVIEQNNEVDLAARAFMSALGYRGMVNVGFRYDARDGRFKVVDVNPRLGASFRSFVTADGSDILRACYLDLTAQRVPDSDPRVGRKWLLELDLKSSVAYRREGESYRKLFAPYRGVEEMAYFSADDPAPLFATVLGVLCRSTYRKLKSLNHYNASAKKHSSAFGV